MVISPLYRGDFSNYGDFMIPYDPKTEICPYRTKEMREKWYQERGLKDTGPVVAPAEQDTSKPVWRTQQTCPNSVVVPDEVKAPPLQETKEQRYRARNKERILAKQRERRAKK
jgi:hypothetical protein